MRTYLSYSITESDHAVISILSNELRRKRFAIETNFDWIGKVSNRAKQQILDCQLFIGYTSKSNRQCNKVLKEYDFSCQSSLPSYILFEDGMFDPKQLNNRGYRIPFNWNKPDSALKYLYSQLPDLKKIGNSTSQTSNDLERVAPWLIGGLALIALFAALADRK